MTPGPAQVQEPEEAFKIYPTLGFPVHERQTMKHIEENRDVRTPHAPGETRVAPDNAHPWNYGSHMRQDASVQICMPFITALRGMSNQMKDVGC